MTNLEPGRDFATEVVARLQGAGFRALWAGGCVRDLILGETPADYDVATDARPDQVMRLFRRTISVGVSFGVVRVLGPPRVGEVEVATFRSDGAYLDGRRPESVTFSSPEADAARRDFTINGMFLDPTTGAILDFVGGRDDLNARVLRAIGDPAARFAEDKLRLLRAARFAARFGLAIEPATRSAIAAMADQVRVVAAERIAQELRKMLVHASRARGMALANDLGLVGAILPEVAKMVGTPLNDPARPVSDRWDSTLSVLNHLPPEPGFPLAFATLLHEVGTEPESAGAQITDRLARELKLANAERERATWLVGSQRVLNNPQALGTAKLKRLLATPGIDELLALGRAIALASTSDVGAVDFCEAYLRDEPEGPIHPTPLLNGHDLAQHGLKPGPRFKELLDLVYDAQLAGIVRTKAEALAWVECKLAEG